MTMDKLSVLGGEHRGKPPPPPPPPPPAAFGCKKEDQPEDDEDAEVMQVVANGPPQPLRPKKQRVVGLNGTVGDEGGGVVERPMSWEGELSDDELMEPPPHITAGCHGGVMPTVIATGMSGRALGSPMCTEEEGNDDGKQENQENTEISENTVTVRTMGAITNSSGPHTTISLIKSSSSYSTHSQIPNDRPPNAHGAICESLPNHQNTAASRNIIGYSGGPYSQTPSPILTRPTSSSSSRSSYSPSQSPLMGRYVNSASSLYSHTQSPVLSRHTAGNSSDGSACSPSGSPLQTRHITIEGAVFSPTQSPNQVRRGDLDSFSPARSPGQLSGSNISRHRPYNVSVSPGLVHKAGSSTPEQGPVLDSTSSLQPPYQYASQDHLSIETRMNQLSPLSQHPTPEARSTTSSASVASSASDESSASDFSSPTRRPSSDSIDDSRLQLLGDVSHLSGPPGISRQQLLSGPCPICGDRISGFHYGIFSCESCKGFFKRTVQNKKNYVCLRGANCHVSISTRKKCPACRFNKCLRMGMKLEAIREDRTRGGRSTYQCSYTLPTTPLNDERVHFPNDISISPSLLPSDCHTKQDISSSRSSKESAGANSPDEQNQPIVPALIHDILSVEHLWHYTDREPSRSSGQAPTNTKIPDGDQDFLNNLCNIADNRLYKIVKWCKSLPLFREIGMDDQIALLINSWCELLLLSCCYRSMSTPNEIRISNEKSVTISQAQAMGLSPVIERMINLTEHMRRLQVDQYEYVSLKVIILLTSDAHGLKEPDKVRACQKQVLEALQNYTASHYPHQPSKFGELLLRLPELERACQVGKDSLTTKQKAGDMPSFNLLMELLRGDH